MTNICVVGGGNIGAALCWYLAENGQKVTLYTSRPEEWTGSLAYCDTNSGKTYSARIDNVTADPEEAFSRADVVFVTWPAFAREKLVPLLIAHLPTTAWIGMIPGPGGTEPAFSPLVDAGNLLFGMDRAPCVSRLTVYGRHVMAAKKPAVRCGTIPAGAAAMVSERVAQWLGIRCTPLPNYLTVTMTPSNQILHTSRLYEALRMTPRDAEWEKPPMFYAEWDDAASSTLLACDDELRAIAAAMHGFDMSAMISVGRHYEVDSPEALTKKIRSIPSWLGIPFPVVESAGKYRIDRESRYFREDFPYGICVLKGFASLAGIHTPTMDRIILWYEDYARIPPGEGSKGLNFAPQKYGLTSTADIVRFYS